MPRNCYTKTVRSSEHRQRVRQEKELAVIARELHLMGAEPTSTPTVNEVKQRRRLRLAHRRRHKPAPVSAVSAALTQADHTEPEREAC